MGSSYFNLIEGKNSQPKEGRDKQSFIPNPNFFAILIVYLA